jgi:hypothetical protein
MLDGFSRKVIGWALGRTLQSKLPLHALERAIANRQSPPGVVHHSDQGVQYACGQYIQKLFDHRMLPSMSRPANPYDNGRGMIGIMLPLHGVAFSNSFKRVTGHAPKTLSERCSSIQLRWRSWTPQSRSSSGGNVITGLSPRRNAGNGISCFPR